MKLQSILGRIFSQYLQLKKPIARITIAKIIAKSHSGIVVRFFFSFSII